MNRDGTDSRIEVRDLGLMIGMILLVPIAWLLPSAVWAQFSRIVSALFGPVRRLTTGITFTRISSVAQNKGKQNEAKHIENRVFANRIQQELQYLREYRPGGWQPAMRIVGREYVDDAMKSGKGCILWVAPLFFSSLVVKKALHKSGFSTTFLSRSLHGPSNSVFGRRYINVIKTRCEERFLFERLAMQPGAEVAAMRTLRKRTLEGQAVAIAWAAYGSRLLDAPILGGIFPVASGAPGLAVATGAPLLPVYTTYDDSNAFEIVIGPPMQVPEHTIRHEAVAHIVSEYASLLESVVINDPAALTIWRYMKAS